MRATVNIASHFLDIERTVQNMVNNMWNSNISWMWQIWQKFNSTYLPSYDNETKRTKIRRNQISFMAVVVCTELSCQMNLFILFCFDPTHYAIYNILLQTAVLRLSIKIEQIRSSKQEVINNHLIRSKILTLWKNNYTNIYLPLSKKLDCYRKMKKLTNINVWTRYRVFFFDQNNVKRISKTKIRNTNTSQLQYHFFLLPCLNFIFTYQYLYVKYNVTHQCVKSHAFPMESIFCVILRNGKNK